IRVASAANIHSRTGKTARDLRVVVQEPENNEGAAAVGAAKRNYVVRFLEFGARGKKTGGQGWTIKGGATDTREARRAARALRVSGNPLGARTFTAALRSGSISVRKNLKLPNGLIRRQVH